MDLVTAAALLGASAISSATSVYNNKKNIEYAQEANEESIKLANTAHQREIRDLEAAGLNPILSSSSSGASTPQLRTPNLESIDGNITHSASGIARALNGLTEAQVDQAKADASSAQAYADVSKNLAKQELAEAEANAKLAQSQAAAWHYTGLNNQIEEAARVEALTGATPDHMSAVIQTDEGWKTYRDLVQKYRNEIETGRYQSSRSRAVFGDIRAGVSTVGDVLNGVSTAKSLKSKPSVRKVDQTTFRRDSKGRIIQRMRNRYDVDR